MMNQTRLMKKIWIMPPTYHRAYTFFMQTYVSPNQKYALKDIARFIGWFNLDTWEQPTKTEVIDILTWLDKNKFIKLEHYGHADVLITINWNHYYEEQPKNMHEYTIRYQKTVSELYAKKDNSYNFSKEDVVAVHELSSSDVSLAKVKRVADEFFKKGMNPSISLIKDYAIADDCLQMA